MPASGPEAWGRGWGWPGHLPSPLLSVSSWPVGGGGDTSGVESWFMRSLE